MSCSTGNNLAEEMRSRRTFSSATSLLHGLRSTRAFSKQDILVEFAAHRGLHSIGSSGVLIKLEHTTYIRLKKPKSDRVRQLGPSPTGTNASLSEASLIQLKYAAANSPRIPGCFRSFASTDLVFNLMRSRERPSIINELRPCYSTILLLVLGSGLTLREGPPETLPDACRTCLRMSQAQPWCCH